MIKKQNLKGKTRVAGTKVDGEVINILTNYFTLNNIKQ